MGDVVWATRKAGKCSVFLVDGMLVCRDEKGPISLVRATSEKFELLGQFDQPNRSDKNAWAHPVVLDGKLYIRDQGTLYCYDIATKAK